MYWGSVENGCQGGPLPAPGNLGHPQSLVTGPGRILQAGVGKLPHLAGAHPSNGERSRAVWLEVGKEAIVHSEVALPPL